MLYDCRARPHGFVATMLQARTYQDLLKNEHDEALFEHYTTAELVSVKVRSGLPLLDSKPHSRCHVHIKCDLSL